MSAINMLFKKPFSIIKTLFIASLVIFITFLNATILGENFKTDSYNYFHAVAKNNNFTLQSVYIKGRINTPEAQITSAIKTKIGSSIFRVDTDAIHSSLSKIGWVKTATVERRFPNIVFITLKEKKPIAIWQLNGKHHIIDKNGDVLSTKNLHNFSHLKILVGNNANKKVVDFMRIIVHDTALSRVVSSGTWVSNRRWNVTLLNKIIVKLPESNPAQAWKMLAKYAKEKNLLTRKIQSIDLRIDGKIFLHLEQSKKKRGRT